MKTVNVHQAKTQFSKLLAQIEKDGESVVICRHGKPVADLVPYKRPSRLKTDPLLARVEIHYEPTETLTETEWPKASR